MTAMIEADKLKSCLKKEFEQQANSQSHQEKAWKSFESKGLPTRKSEAYQYIPLPKLFQSGLSNDEKTGQEIEIPKVMDHGPSLSFINGNLSAEHSNLGAFPKGVLILPMDEAIEKFSSYLKGRFENHLQREEDPFSLVNYSLSKDAYFIYIPPQAKLEEVVKLRHYTTQSSGSVHPALYFFLGANASINIAQESLRSEESHALSNSLIDIHLEKEASFNLNSMTKSPATSWNLSALRASVMGGASLKVFNFCGEGNLRNDYFVTLEEEEAYASLTGLWTCFDKYQSHAHVLMEHKAPNCISSQLFKGILSDHSRSSFEGKIYIHPEAQQTEAYQSNHNLLLSDTAFGASKPNLEIFADDVKASHGSTTGQIDEEQLFYLRTRGIPEETAKRFLVKAFCQDVVSKVEDSPFTQLVNKEIANSLKHALKE